MLMYLAFIMLLIAGACAMILIFYKDKGQHSEPVREIEKKNVAAHQ